MKTRCTVLIHIAILFTIILVAGCKKKTIGDPLDEMRLETINKLAGTWNLSAVSKDNTDVSSNFTNFSISFSGMAFSTFSGGDVWQPNGSWMFAEASFTKITRSDLTEITLAFSDNDTKLTLSFVVVDPGGRTLSIAGQYVFQVSR